MSDGLYSTISSPIFRALMYCLHLQNRVLGETPKRLWNYVGLRGDVTSHDNALRVHRYGNLISNRNIIASRYTDYATLDLISFVKIGYQNIVRFLTLVTGHDNYLCSRPANANWRPTGRMRPAAWFILAPANFAID
jgi:hypothetical protein